MISLNESFIGSNTYKARSLIVESKDLKPVSC